MPDGQATINGLSGGARRAARQRESKAVVAELETWMRTERIRLSRHAETAKAIDYMLTRWPAFTRFLDDGRICGVGWLYEHDSGLRDPYGRRLRQRRG